MLHPLSSTSGLPLNLDSVCSSKIAAQLITFLVALESDTRGDILFQLLRVSYARDQSEVSSPDLGSESFEF